MSSWVAVVTALVVHPPYPRGPDQLLRRNCPVVCWSPKSPLHHCVVSALRLPETPFGNVVADTYSEQLQASGETASADVRGPRCRERPVPLQVTLAVQ
jgi:hypothetical protein